MTSRVFSFPKEKRENNSGHRDSPDPGAYDVVSGMKVVKESSPEWTFSRTQKDGLRGDNLPGPGQYDGDINKVGITDQTHNILQLKHNVSYSMGIKPNSQNQSGIAKDYSMPGPGAYDYQSMNKSPSFSMSPRKNEGKPSDVPGPGQYENKHKNFGIDSRKITMSGRPQTAKVIDAPGPGQYDNKHKMIGGDRSLRGTSAMKSKQERIQSPSKDQLSKPGPGAYDANPHSVRDKTPTFRFGTSGRDNLVNKEEKLKPGPGAYEIKNLKSARAVKIGQRLSSAIKNDVPGPGNYEPNHNYGKSSVRGVKMSKQQQRSSIMNHSKSTMNIGPGEYNVVEDFGKRAPKVTIQGRKNNEKLKDIPGPGAYDPADHLVKSKITSTVIKSTKKESTFHQKTESTPGPGNYYRDEFGKNTQSFTIQGRTEYRRQELSPGPGAYDARDNLTKSITPTYKQSQSRREDLVSKQAKELPGPGAYNYSSHKTIGKDTVTYTMGSKTQIIEREKSPGPGAYEPDHNCVKDKVKSLKMSTSKRPDIAPKTARDIPGPGLYSSPHKSIGKDSYQYTMGTKRNDQRVNDIPGPGSYDTKDTVMRDKSPSYRLGTSERGKLINKSMIDQPGPGYYDQKSKETGPKYTFTARNEPKMRDDKPGPGNYDPRNEVVKDNVRSFKMGSSSRTELVSKEVIYRPGPGQYVNDEHDQFGKNAQKVSIRGKPEEKIRNDNPGPGSYQPNEKIVKDSVRAYKIDSTSKRSQIVTKEMLNAPGPGEYDSPKRFGYDAPHVTIRGKPEQNFRDDSPGPGMYDPNSEIVKDKVRAFKMGQSSRGDFISKEEKMKPGPGIYEQKSSIGQNTYTYTMGGKPTHNYDNKLPGPGAYDANDSPTRYNSPSVMIRSGSKSARGEIVSGEKLSMPGPGSYDQHSNIGKGRAVQISGKTVYEKASDVPGPGSYNASPEVVKDRVKSAKIGQNKRDFLSPSHEDLQKPGPGYYDQKLPQNNITYSIGGKPTYNPANDVPGPGQYNESDKFTKYQTPSVNFGRSPDRSTSFSPRRDVDVGPGMYDVKDKSDVICYSFSKGELRDSQNGTPGPGAYKLPSKFADVPPYVKMGNSNEDFKYV